MKQVLYRQMKDAYAFKVRFFLIYLNLSFNVFFYLCYLVSGVVSLIVMY